MKKTETVSIAKRSFQIENDAYNLLDSYIRNLEAHFAKSDPSGEIVADIEEHIAELFEEHTRQGVYVLTMEDIKSVIERVGSVDEIIHSDPENETHQEKNSTGTATPPLPPLPPKFRPRAQRKTYYRHPTNRWFGGVLGGLGSYFKIDPLFLRLVTLLLLFTPMSYYIIVLYIAVWFYINEAKSIAELLEMEGEEVTANTIWQKVSSTASASGLGGEKSGSSPLPGSMNRLKEEADRILPVENKQKRTILITAMAAVGAILLIALPFLLYKTHMFHSYFYMGNTFNHLIDNVLPTFAGTFGIFILIPIILLILLVMLFFFALSIVPTGMILRTEKWNIYTKALLIILWFVFLSWVF
ncbi:MAG: PspC domain-containing protein [Porphyromonas sp.]|nr:PspC domain-containing protein [Porphyromonas sp.]